MFRLSSSQKNTCYVPHQQRLVLSKLQTVTRMLVFLSAVDLHSHILCLRTARIIKIWIPQSLFLREKYKLSASAACSKLCSTFSIREMKSLINLICFVLFWLIFVCFYLHIYSGCVVNMVSDFHSKHVS